jgi:hypothetical protein
MAQPEWMQAVVREWMQPALEELEQDRQVLEAGRVPARLTVAAAFVARDGVMRADAAASGKRKIRPGREARARALLEVELAREFRLLLEQTLQHGWLAGTADGSMLRLDWLLLERLRELQEAAPVMLEAAAHSALERVRAELEADARAVWLQSVSQSQHKLQAPLPLFDGGELEWQAQFDDAATPGALEPWLVRCSVAPAAVPAGVDGEGKDARVQAFAPPERQAVLWVPALQEMVDAAGGYKAELALVLMMGLPVPAEAAQMAERVTAQARQAAAAVTAAAQAATLAEWAKQTRPNGKPALARLVVLAVAVWQTVVRELWDTGERRRKAQPAAVEPVRAMQRFLAASGKPEMVRGGRVQMTRIADGSVLTEDELCELVSSKCIPAQSVNGQKLVRWCLTEARVLAGEGGQVIIAGGWRGLAREVLQQEEPDDDAVTEFRKVSESLASLAYRVPWGREHNLVGAKVLAEVMTMQSNRDGRERLLVMTPGSLASMHGVPALAELPAGLRDLARQLPTVSREVMPAKVLGNRNAAAEEMLPDELLRLMLRCRADYARGGVRVSDAMLADVLAGCGVQPTPDKVAKVREELLTAKQERAAKGEPLLAPFVVADDAGRWRINAARWEAGHTWLMQATQAPERVQKRAAGRNRKGASL